MPALTIPTSDVAIACADGHYHCGHVTRSSSRPVKRALFLFLAESEGLGYLGTRTEAAEVLAVLALMRQGAHCAEVLAAGGAAATALIEASVTDRQRDCTPEQVEVLRLVAEGFSYPEIAAETGRATETVRSLVKAAMRNTCTHTAVDAAVTLAEWGVL